MALNITKVPDITYLLGESGIIREFALVPSTSDYVTGGWPITAAQVELGYLNAAKVVGTNAAGALYDAEFVFPAATFGNPAASPAVPPQAATAVNLLVSQSGVQVANGTDLSGVRFLADFRGW